MLARYHNEMDAVKSVDDYIALAPTESRERLEALRAAIKMAAPDAEERISYGMPHYHYKGRLVYFSLWKKHIGMYALATSVLEAHKDELKGKVTEKGTVQFPLDEQLPVDLIQRLVKAQVKQNDEAAKNP
jgi:uncharacterized protein YdhG (YjbR/CyaY superfamily)